MRFPLCPYHVLDVLTPGIGVGLKSRLSLGWRRDRYPLHYIIAQKNSGGKSAFRHAWEGFYFDERKEPARADDRRRPEN